MVPAQQPPERARVTLHAVCAAHNEDRRVKHRERALRFAGKIHMARRIEKGYGAVFPCESRLLGKDRDAALTLLRVSVEKSVRMVDAAQTTKRAGGIEKRLGERRFPGVHVRKNADAQRGHFRI